jgi:hypothetical protein
MMRGIAVKHATITAEERGVRDTTNATAMNSNSSPPIAVRQAGGARVALHALDDVRARLVSPGFPHPQEEQPLRVVRGDEAECDAIEPGALEDGEQLTPVEERGKRCPFGIREQHRRREHDPDR